MDVARQYSILGYYGCGHLKFMVIEGSHARLRYNNRKVLQTLFTAPDILKECDCYSITWTLVYDTHACDPSTISNNM